MTEHKKIPLYTKIGSNLTLILMLILTFFLLKNCIGAIFYGTATYKNEVSHYYQWGFTDGLNQANGASIVEPVIDNPLLKKAYRQGFRKGWDSLQHEKKPEEDGSAGNEEVRK